MDGRGVYFDNAATTRVDDWGIARMMPFYSESYGNASSLHGYGTEAKECQEECRNIEEEVLGFLNALPSEMRKLKPIYSIA